jgi:hypothetical protein
MIDLCISLAVNTSAVRCANNCPVTRHGMLEFALEMLLSLEVVRSTRISSKYHEDSCLV